MISVLDQYDKFLQVFSHPIIEWKTAQRKLVYYKSVKKSIFWCFNVLGGFGLHCLAGTFLLLLVLHGSTTLSPLPVLMVHVILLFLWCYNLSAGLALMIHGERFVDGWNLLFAKFRKVESKGMILSSTFCKLRICTCSKNFVIQSSFILFQTYFISRHLSLFLTYNDGTHDNFAKS